MFRAFLAASFVLAVVGTAGVAGHAQPDASSSSPAIAPPAPQLSQLVGFVDARLVRIDDETLRPLTGKGIAVGSGGCAPRAGGSACWTNPPWTSSPDGAKLALARNDSSSVQLVDVNRMRITAAIRLRGGPIGALAWFTGRWMLAVEEVAGERQRVVALDLLKGRVAARRVLGGSVQQLVRTADELIMLLAPAKTIGPARIAVADRRGAVRFVRLERIFSGSKLLGTGSGHRVDARTPGFVVDREGRRAFIVAKDLGAEVDLRTLAVSYHVLKRPRSLLSRLWNWLEPTAAAKQVSGYSRQAQWLGADRIAVSGGDTEQGQHQPAGLLVIDSSDWSVRMFDRGATGFEVVSDALLATGGGWDAATERSIGIGLAAYGFDGGKRFQLFDGEHAWVAQVYDNRAYVGISGQEPLRIVDLSSGQVVGVREQPLPWLLLGPASGWWGDG